MVKNRRRSMVCKMVLAGTFTALVLENSIQNGLFVPVHAEEADENYTDSQEWQDFKSYWVTETDKQINNFVASQSPELQAQYLTYILAGNMAIANMEYQQNALALRADPETGAIDYSVDVPAGQIVCGWYYRANKPHAIILFGYNQSGDWIELNNNNIVVMSSDEFTVSVSVTLDSSVVYHGLRSELSSSSETNNAINYYLYNASPNAFVGSGYVSNYTSVGYQKTFQTKYYLSNYFNIDNTSYSANAFVGYYSTYDYTYHYSPNMMYCGLLKDSSGQPISNSYQKFVRAQVGNNFPAFLSDLKQQLDDNFPEEVVNELWYDPTQGEPLPDVGTLDSLTFPPGLPSNSFNDVELPSEPLPAKMLSGASFWFTQFTNMLDALGVKYIVITFLIIALILAILKI